MDEKLKTVISAVLGLHENEISPELNAAEVDRWDSLGHLELILAVEKEYGVRFPADDIPRLKSVAQIEQALRITTISHSQGTDSACRPQ